MKPLLLRSLLLLAFFPLRLLAIDEVPVAPPAAANGPAYLAIKALREGRPTAAAEMARPLAEKGDRDALFLLGFALESMLDAPRQSRGQAMDNYYRKAAAAGYPGAEMRSKLVRMASGGKQEREEIRRGFEAAAEAKDPLACRILGEAWLRGLADGKADADKALQYWKQAAAAGDRYSLVLTAKLHAGDFGFPEKKDPAGAIAAYRQAAELGEAEAFIPLGSLLTASEPEEARKWLEKALAQEDPRARCALGDYEARSSKDRKAALEHYLLGADAGNTDCKHRLATLFSEEGAREWLQEAVNARKPATSLSEDVLASQAREWLQKAADAGNPAAAADLGHRLLQGEAPDFPAARRYLTAAAIERQRAAQYDLALLYLNAKAGTPDPVAAVAWLTEAMKSGDPDVQYKLATLHEEGKGTPVNYANAGVLYTLACNKGHAPSAVRISRMAVEGLGTSKSTVQAWAYASLAVELGDETTKAWLAELDGKLSEEDREAAKKALERLRAQNKKLSGAGGTEGKPATP